MPSSLLPSLSHIKETCLYIKDTTRTRAFYESILQLRCITEVPTQFVFFAVGEDRLLCFVTEFSRNNPTLPAHYAEGPQHIAFEAPTSEAYITWRNHLKSAGISIEHETTWPTGRRSFYFRDPDGHSIEILEPGVWGT